MQLVVVAACKAISECCVSFTKGVGYYGEKLMGDIRGPQMQEAYFLKKSKTWNVPAAVELSPWEMILKVEFSCGRKMKGVCNSPENVRRKVLVCVIYRTG